MDELTEREKCLINAFISIAGGHDKAQKICIDHASAAGSVDDSKRYQTWREIWTLIQDEKIRMNK